MAKVTYTNFELIADGLGYPEGPIWMPDGSLLLVEIRAQCLSRIGPDGSRDVVAKLPGGPNGAAVGPDGKIFVCNDGGFQWIPIPPDKPVLYIGGDQPDDYQGGSIQVVDPDSGSFEDLYRDCGHWTDMRGFGPRKPRSGVLKPAFKLCGPDDLVFDAHGGFWFSDFGKTRPRDRDITGIFYGRPDGSSIELRIFPLNSPNGVALSPDGKRLYAALTYERLVLYWELDDAGEIVPNPSTMDGSYLLSADLPGRAILDSMAVDSDGNVHVAVMLPQGADPMVNGGIAVISSDGATVDYVPIEIKSRVAPLPSNVCFGGDDLKTAFITCGASGMLLKADVSVPGLVLNHSQG